MIVSNIISIVVTSIILRYVVELEEKKCTCALNGQQKFIKYFSPILIILSLIGLFVNRRTMMKTLQGNRFLALLLIAYGIAVILYTINLVVYFLRLKYSGCICSKDWKRWGLLYPVLIFSIAMLIAVIVLVLSVLGLIPSSLLRMVGKKGQNNNTVKELLSNINSNTNSRKTGRK